MPTKSLLLLLFLFACLFWDALCKTKVISLVSLNLTLKLSQDFQLELLHHCIKFCPDQMKRVEENKANGFCFALTLWPPGRVRISKSGIKMVEVNGVSKHGRHEKMWWKVACKCLTFVFATQDGRRTNTTNDLYPYDIHMDLKKPKTPTHNKQTKNNIMRSAFRRCTQSCSRSSVFAFPFHLVNVYTSPQTTQRSLRSTPLFLTLNTTFSRTQVWWDTVIFAVNHKTRCATSSGTKTNTRQKIQPHCTQHSVRSLDLSHPHPWTTLFQLKCCWN